MVALNSSLADVPWAWSVAQCPECVVEGAVLADFGIDFDLGPVIVVAVTAVLLVAVADPELVDLVAVVDECCQVETIASHSAVGQCDAGHIRLVALCYGLFYRSFRCVAFRHVHLPGESLFASHGQEELHRLCRLRQVLVTFQLLPYTEAFHVA